MDVKFLVLVFNYIYYNKNRTQQVSSIFYFFLLLFGLLKSTLHCVEFAEFYFKQSMGVHEAVYTQHIPTTHICAVMFLTIKKYEK